MTTIFKKIINREVPAEILYEDELCLSFRDVNPATPFHVLLIPKKEIATLNDLNQEEINLYGHLLLKASEIAKDNGFKTDGYRLVINCNEYGGQTVFHLHIHILAGRHLTWPPG